MKEPFPISKHSKETGWIFIKETTGSYEEAQLEAKKLQEADPLFSYRVWDDR